MKWLAIAVTVNTLTGQVTTDKREYTERSKCQIVTAAFVKTSRPQMEKRAWCQKVRV